MQKDKKKVFLAANSSEGFVSFFKESYDLRKGWSAYIIKGGPGTGKSTFIRKIAEAAEKKGMKPVYCCCSSDSDSLDGVIIEEMKTVILDGTPPHTVEPELYGVCEQIINLGEFLDCKALKKNDGKIIALKDKNSFYHKSASRYIAAFGQLYFENYKFARQIIDYKKINRFAERLCKKYVKPKNNVQGIKKNVFISGITPRGILNFTDTLKNYAEKFVIIEDKYGAAAGIIIQAVTNFALLSGYEVTVIKNPFFPSELSDGVIIPELSICFVCENEYLKFDKTDRKIHSSRFYNSESLKKHRNRIFFNRRVGKSLLLCGISFLKKAKCIHDEIEEYYKNSADFDKIDIKNAEFIENELNM